MSVFNILHTYRKTTYNATSAKIITYQLVHKQLINSITSKGSDEVKPAGETVNVRSLINIIYNKPILGMEFALQLAQWQFWDKKIQINLVLQTCNCFKNNRKTPIFSIAHDFWSYTNYYHFSNHFCQFVTVIYNRPMMKVVPKLLSPLCQMIRAHEAVITKH